MSGTNAKGEIGEAAFVLAATKRGYWTAKMPQACPYDFVLDRGNGVIERIQVKYRTPKQRGVFMVKLVQNTFTNRRDYTADNIDAFAIYVSTLDTVYLVPIAEVFGYEEVTFRVEAPKNNQIDGIRMITSYEQL